MVDLPMGAYASGLRTSLAHPAGHPRTGLLVVDQQAVIVWANPAAETLLRRPITQLLGKPFSAIVAGQSAPVARRMRNRARRGVATTGAHIHVTKEDGTVRPVEVDVFPVGYAVATAGGAIFVLREDSPEVPPDAEPGDILHEHLRLGFGQGSVPQALLDIGGRDRREDREAPHHLLESALETPGEPARSVLRITDADGNWRWMEETLTDALDDPAVGGLVANLRDVTEQVETRRELEASASRYRAIVEAAHDGIIALDDQGNVVFANEWLGELFGLLPEEIYEVGLWPAFSPDRAAELHQRVLGRADAGPERYELDFIDVEGRPRILSVWATPLVQSNGTGSLATITDVTAERGTEAELRHRALHDPLTGLPNRILFSDRAQMAVARMGRAGSAGIAVLYLDLDHMKVVNDRVGHVLGDGMLIEVAGRLKSAVREVDTVARLGGDEFVILCEGVDSELATSIAQRVQAAFTEPFVIDGHEFRTTTSIGIAMSPPHHPDDLLRFADAAMYRAKQHQRGSLLLFDQELAHEADRRSKLRRDVRDVVKGQGLVVLYQPIVELDTGRLCGVEALSRWSHPTMGRLGAGELMRAVAAADLQHEFDEAVLGRACRDMRELIDTRQLPPDTYVSVNLGFWNTGLPSVEQVVARVLDESGLAPGNLVLEISEGSMLADVAATAAMLGRLSERGVRVAVDDFGTGYSSLAHLHRLPLDILKIDKSFVSDLSGEWTPRAIIGSIVGLADALSLQTVAEGVETAEQAHLLRDMGCTHAQGFWWSEPVARESLADLVARWS